MIKLCHGDMLLLFFFVYAHFEWKPFFLFHHDWHNEIIEHPLPYPHKIGSFVH